MHRLAFIFLFIPSFLYAQEKTQFNISGNIQGLNEGEQVLLGNRFLDWHYLTMIDSCKVVNGSFVLKGGSVPEGPREYEVVFMGKHRVTKTDGHNIGGSSITLLINNGDHIVIKGDTTNINNVKSDDFTNEITIEGSSGTTGWLALLPAFYQTERFYFILSRQFDEVKDSIGFERNLIQGLIKSKNIIDEGLEAILLDYNMKYFSPAIPRFMASINDISSSHYHASFLPRLYESLNDQAKLSFYGKQLKENSKLAVGQKMPDFRLSSVDGKKISLNEEVRKSKLTVIHLWGSNSYLREKFQAELLSFHNHYYNKGLQIIAVSADASDDDWKFTVHQKKYPWINVSDLKGFGRGSLINDVYHEGGHSIPNTTNILLDQNGKIIAWDVNGLELQWYLWKYLGD